MREVQKKFVLSLHSPHTQNYGPESKSKLSLACNAGVFRGRANAIAAILDFKGIGRLGRVERATSPQFPKILQIQHGGYDNRDFGTRASPRKRLHCRLNYHRIQV